MIGNKKILGLYWYYSGGFGSKNIYKHFRLYLFNKYFNLFKVIKNIY